METVTVSQLSLGLGVSTRMLRYYEQIGLLQSQRQEGYAYRIYDEVAVSRLRMILTLRRLRIPLKQIQTLVQNPGAEEAIRVFRQNLTEMDERIAALSTVRAVLAQLLEKLTQGTGLGVQRLLEQDEALLTAIRNLNLTPITLKEDPMMEQLNRAEQTLHKLTDVRILYLPPATVAAAHFIGEEPEAHVGQMIGDFVRESRLFDRKPDLRHFGFNHPNPVDETGFHGYEMWVTIPEDMEVPAPLTRKHFPGGLYAAHMIPMGNFHEWPWLMEWLQQQEQYEFAGDMADAEHMHGLLEEHLNYAAHVRQGNLEPEGLQLDLLLPVRER